MSHHPACRKAVRQLEGPLPSPAALTCLLWTSFAERISAGVLQSFHVTLSPFYAASCAGEVLCFDIEELHTNGLVVGMVQVGLLDFIRYTK